MEIPKIIDCAVKECAYNKRKQCHAAAITVGSSHPRCDTFMADRHKGGIPETSGSVGACHMRDCRFNRSLECSAEGIHVNMNSGHPDCITYSPK